MRITEIQQGSSVRIVMEMSRPAKRILAAAIMLSLAAFYFEAIQHLIQLGHTARAPKLTKPDFLAQFREEQA